MGVRQPNREQAHANTDPDSDTYPNTDSDLYTNSYSNTYIHADTNAHRDAYSYCHAHTGTYGHTHNRADCDAGSANRYTHSGNTGDTHPAGRNHGVRHRCRRIDGGRSHHARADNHGGSNGNARTHSRDHPDAGCGLRRLRVQCHQVLACGRGSGQLSSDHRSSGDDSGPEAPRGAQGTEIVVRRRRRDRFPLLTTRKPQI